MEFPLAETITKDDVFLCQEKLLDMAVSIVDIFDQNNIKYIIFFGSLLGAVRHQGFIPWDDDFDLVVFDEDYMRALKCLERELPARYKLHSRKTDPYYFHSWNRVRDTRIKVEFENHYHSHNALVDFSNLGVDVHCFKKLKLGEVNAYLKFEKQQFLLRKFEMGIISRGDFEQGFEATSEQNFVPPEDIGNKKNETVFANVVGLNAPIKFDDVFPLIDFEFVDQTFKGPGGFDNILKSIYGDYNSLPKYQDRKPSLKSIEFLK